jgi:protein ImuB
MAFASIHVPDFLVQAVVRARAHLRFSAIALVDGVPPLVKVIAASPAALEAGIQIGMQKSQAEQFTAVEIYNRSPSSEKAAHDAMLDLGWSISPRVEDHAPHEIAVDLAGLETLLGSPETIAAEILRRASDLGLAAHVAISANLDVAIHAARGFSGSTVIFAGTEASRLGPLPIDVLSPSNDAAETLARWGIRTCAALAALPPLQLSERLGREGVRIHAHARGKSVRALILAEPERFFEEEMELDEAVEDIEPLSFLLGRLLDQLCARLVARALSAAAIHLRFDLGDIFEYEAAPDVTPPPLFAERKAKKVYRKSLTLPVAMRDSKLLLKLIRLQLQSDPPPGTIVKIGLAADPARPRFSQTGLFVPSAPDPEKLELVVARLAKMVGENNVGAAELVDTHRPGAFRMAHFTSASASNERNATGTSTRPGTRARRSRECETTNPHAFAESLQSPRLTAAFRTFRPPLHAHVELRSGSPARVFFRGMRGYVMSASGPWRTSGDWWRDDAWLQDEWDLDIRFDPTHNAAHTPAPQAFPPSMERARHESSRGIASLGFVHTQRTQPTQPVAVAVAPTGLYCFCFDAAAKSWSVRGVYD